jgi:hypothetical protein
MQVVALHMVTFLVTNLVMPLSIWLPFQPPDTYAKVVSFGSVYWYKIQPTKAALPSQDTEDRGYTLKSKQSLFKQKMDFPVYTLQPSWYLSYSEAAFYSVNESLVNTLVLLALWIYQRLQQLNYVTNQPTPKYTSLADIPYKTTVTAVELASISVLRWLPCNSKCNLETSSRIELPYDYTWPDQVSWVQIEDRQAAAVKIFGRKWTKKECTPTEWDYATVATRSGLFHSAGVLTHATMGHFLFNAIYLATHRNLHPRHPLYIFLSASMHGAYRLVQQTGSVATSDGGVTGAFIQLPGIANLSDFIHSWTSSDFSADDPVFVGQPFGAQQQYEISLLDRIRETCHKLVDSIYESEGALISDPEVQEWFEILRAEIPGMFREMTRANLSHILYRFHACIVFHDMFHRLELLVNIGTGTRPGDVLSLFPSKYDHIVQQGLVAGVVRQQGEFGMPFGFFWSDLFHQDPKYRQILDTAKAKIDALHVDAMGQKVVLVNSTIMM